VNHHADFGCSALPKRSDFLPQAFFPHESRWNESDSHPTRIHGFTKSNIPTKNQGKSMRETSFVCPPNVFRRQRHTPLYGARLLLNFSTDYLEHEKQYRHTFIKSSEKVNSNR
jgi:hypothetical protein